MVRVDDRHPRVLALLLSSLTDYQPGPATDRRNPLSVRQPSPSAWAPSEYVLCPDCDLDGTVKRGKHRMTCPRCGGAGCWPVDAYDNNARPLEVANGSKLDAAAAIRQFSDLTLTELERALERLEQAKVRADEDPLWRALERQTRYRIRPLWCRQLRHALDGLPPYQRFLVNWCYVDQVQPPSQLRPPFDERLRAAVDAVGDTLPSGFVAPRWALDAAQAEQDAAERERRKRPYKPPGRDEMIVAMRENGQSLRQIGARVGMTARGVLKVLQRQEQKAA